MENLYIKKTDKKDYDDFKKQLQHSFNDAVIKSIGPIDKNVIPDEDIQKSLDNPSSEIFDIYYENKKVGGIIVQIDYETQHNFLDWLYVLPSFHNKGIGAQIWDIIEQKYPDTKIWELITPYFEKRNINFYINKCGFKIVEFIHKNYKSKNKHLKDMDLSNRIGREEVFLFQKVMKK